MDVVESAPGLKLKQSACDNTAAGSRGSTIKNRSIFINLHCCVASIVECCSPAHVSSALAQRDNGVYDLGMHSLVVKHPNRTVAQVNH